MTLLYEEAIETVKNKNIFKMNVVFTGPVLLSFLVGLPFLIVTFITKEAHGITTLLIICLVGYLIWAIIATLARDKIKSDSFNSICAKIENCPDEPYKLNKYIYDNLQFRKQTTLGHVKFISKGISFFQITSLIKYEYIPNHYRSALVIIGFFSTLLYLSLHVFDERTESLKTALQLSQKRKWQNNDQNQRDDEMPNNSAAHGLR